MMIPDGQIWAEFLKMNIQHSRLTTAHCVYDNLRRMKVLAPNRPQKCACLFAPTQSGKSKTVETYIENCVVDEVWASGLFPADMERSKVAEHQRVALHVTLDSKATPKSFASTILTKFGDPRANKGTQPDLLGRVYDYMNYHGTQILFLDEIQHLDHRQTQTTNELRRAAIPESTAVTDTLKTMLIRGLVPIVFIGIEEAENMVLGDSQIRGRCLTKIDFACLRSDVQEERDIFIDYCGRLGLKLRQHHIFEEETNLIEGDIPALIHEVASGRLGMASNLVAAACTIARERGATRLHREHLSRAVDEWAIPMKLIDYNPFERGIDGYERRTA